MQVIAEAIDALTALMLTMADAKNDTGSSKAKGCIQKHGQKLQEALHGARYHQIKQCRVAATEAAAVLQALLPAGLLQQGKQRQGAAVAQSTDGQRRKGPWLHEKVATASATVAEAPNRALAGPKTKRLAALVSAEDASRWQPDRYVTRLMHRSFWASHRGRFLTDVTAHHMSCSLLGSCT